LPFFLRQPPMSPPHRSPPLSTGKLPLNTSPGRLRCVIGLYHSFKKRSSASFPGMEFCCPPLLFFVQYPKSASWSPLLTQPNSFFFEGPRPRASFFVDATSSLRPWLFKSVFSPRSNEPFSLSSFHGFTFFSPFLLHLANVVSLPIKSLCLKDCIPGIVPSLWLASCLVSALFFLFFFFTLRWMPGSFVCRAKPPSFRYFFFPSLAPGDIDRLSSYH